MPPYCCHQARHADDLHMCRHILLLETVVLQGSRNTVVSLTSLCLLMWAAMGLCSKSIDDLTHGARDLQAGASRRQLHATAAPTS